MRNQGLGSWTARRARTAADWPDRAIVAVDLAKRAQRRCVAYATRTLSPSRPAAAGAGAGAGVRRSVPRSSRAP